MRRAVDSYTRQPVVEEAPRKKLPHINRGRSLYAHWRRDSASGPQYAAHETEDGFLIHREGEWLPFLGPYSLEQARKVLHFMVENDASLLIAVGWMKRSIPEPLFKFVEKANDAAQ